MAATINLKEWTNSPIAPPHDPALTYKVWKEDLDPFNNALEHGTVGINSGHYKVAGTMAIDESRNYTGGTGTFTGALSALQLSLNGSLFANSSRQIPFTPFQFGGGTNADQTVEFLTGAANNPKMLFDSATNEFNWIKRGETTKRKFGTAIYYNVTDYGAKGDGVTNDQAAITSAIDAATVTGGIVYLPRGTYICNSALRMKNGVELQGEGMYATTIKLGAGANQNLIVNNDVPAGNSNLAITDLSLDGNKANQTLAFYILGFQFVTNVRIERVRFFNIWGTSLWINGPDDLAYRPLPDATQINFNVKVFSCIFDGTSQTTPESDQIVVGRTRFAEFAHNKVSGAGASLLAWQFNKYSYIHNNEFFDAWRMIYVETCQYVTVSENAIHTIGTAAPIIGTAAARGIWLVTADETYGVGAGYAGCKFYQVRDNHLYFNYKPLTIAEGYGIAVTARGATPALMGVISGNVIEEVKNDAIRLEGATYHLAVQNNSVRGGSRGLVGALTYQGDTGLFDLRFVGNRAISVSTGILLTNDQRTVVTANDFWDCNTAFSIGTTGAQIYGNIGQNVTGGTYPSENFMIGMGTPIKRHRSTTFSWNPLSIAAGGYATTTFSYAGPAVGDQVVATIQELGTNDMTVHAHVQATDAVRVFLFNHSGAAIDLPAVTVRLDLWQHGAGDYL